MDWLIFSSRWERWLEIFKNTVFNTPRNICCGYLLESSRRGDSNKYPQHMFLGVYMWKKSFLSFIILVHVGILYSNKFLLTAESWGTNDVIITRLPCISLHRNLIQSYRCVCKGMDVWVLFLHGGRTLTKPSSLDWPPLPCHMPILGIKPRLVCKKAKDMPILFRSGGEISM